MQGISYHSDFQAWWPDYDHNPSGCFAYVQKHLHEVDYAVSICKGYDVCVQAGGHAGYWPLHLAQKFKTIYTFECEPLLFECLKLNIGSQPNIITSSYALGAAAGKVKMRPSQSAGSWRIDPDGTLEVEVITIDSLNLEKCDALILDIEGYEIPALKGAHSTINKFNPIVHVEELDRSKGTTGKYLQKIGYKLVKVIGKDRVYVRK